jgi:NAD-dependent dihydropyrimidine dehydrogenase PreA subunit
MIGIPQNIVTIRQSTICEEMCKAYGFTSSKDKDTRITREDALRAGPTIDKYREEIIRIYPHDCKKKIRTGEKGDLVNLTILRQLLKHHNKRIQSFRTSGQENGRGYKYRYNLLM